MTGQWPGERAHERHFAHALRLRRPSHHPAPRPAPGVAGLFRRDEAAAVRSAPADAVVGWHSMPLRCALDAVGAGVLMIGDIRTGNHQRACCWRPSQ